MSVSSTFQPLFRQVSELRTENADGRKFIPEKELRRIITQDVITKIVEDFTQADRVKEVVDFVIQDAPTIFGILVLISHVRGIHSFIRTDQLQARHADDRLPLSKDALKAILDDDLRADLFHEKQWEFCAPVFSGRIIPRIFERQTILPYLSDVFISSGAFGSVHKIVIHPSHRPKGYEGIAEYARKELELDDSTYDNEIRVLSTLQRLDHPNILRILACYTLGSKHNLISPFVRSGTLTDFLEREKPAALSQSGFFSLIAGLASATWALHVFVLDDTKPSRKGHHQDLSHDNVLFDGGRFVLADFGLSSIKSMSQGTKTPFKGRKGYCQAPECADLALPYQEHEITPAADIFALGCIIADLIVYLERGQSGLKEFRDSRKFQMAPMSYFLYHKGDIPNDAVSAMMGEISHSSSSKSIHTVIHLVTQMLEVAPMKRPTAGEATARLYVLTIEAFREEFVALYARFGDCPDAIVEQARFESWTMSLDTHYFQTRSGPTDTQRMFNSVVGILASMKAALDSIDIVANLDCQDFVEVRQLNTELLNMLSQDKAATARAQLKSILLANMTPKRTDAVYKALMMAFGGSKITEMAETKQKVAQVDQALLNTFKLPFAKVYGAIKARRTVGNFKIADVNTGEAAGIRPMVIEAIQYQDQYRRTRLMSRITALCDLLRSSMARSELKIPPFYGVHDNSGAFSFELLYDFPDGQSGPLSCVSLMTLHDLLMEPDRSTYPAMETRLRLALDLAEALAAFHDVSWFHKDLTSHNILFFTENATPSLRASNPYVLGFQHSRSATDDFTEGPLQDRNHHRYHDPRYISTENRQFKEFRPQFDYYSLGIVLVEIGFWDPISRIMSEHTKTDNFTFSQIVINQKLPELAFGMGLKYIDLVRHCLTGLGQIESQAASPSRLKLPLTSSFEQKVILPLRSFGFLQHYQDVKKRKRESDVSAAAISESVKKQRPL